METKYISGETSWISQEKKYCQSKKEFLSSWPLRWARPQPMNFYLAAEVRGLKKNNMPDHRYTILSTASIPFERIPKIPENVDLQIIPFIEIVPREEESLRKQIISLADETRTVVFTSAHAVRWVAR